MPPEQLEAATNVDERSDIWSLGTILYELLRGRPPFEAETMTGLYACILRDPPPPLPSAPPALEAVVLRCLEKDPRNRFQNTAELARALVPFGSAEARASAESIARVVEGGIETEDAVAVSHRLATTPTPRRLEPPLLSTMSAARIPMRSPVLGYVAGALMLVVVGGVAGRAAIHRWERLRAVAHAEAPEPTPVTPVSAPPPPAVTTSGGEVVRTAEVTRPASAPTAAPSVSDERPRHVHAHHASPAPRALPEPIVLAPAPTAVTTAASSEGENLFEERK
jgi:hypothetical protein